MNTEASNTQTIPAETVEGWNLLRPLEEIPAWDLIEVWDGLQDLVGEFSGKKPSIKTLSQIMRLMRQVAVDDSTFTDFARGSAGVQRTLTLAVAWMGELGKSVGSES